MLEFSGGHARSRQHPPGLFPRRRGNHHHGIDGAPTPLFEQQRYVEDHQAARTMPAKEQSARLDERGMDDPFESVQRRLVTQHRFGQHSPVDPVRAGRARKGRLDRGDQTSSAPLEPMNLRVGVINGNAQTREHCRNGRFAHADGAGQSDDDHRAAQASSCRRKSSSAPRGAGTPKKCSKATAACPTSMRSPSTVLSPRARASASRGVSSGA